MDTELILNGQKIMCMKIQNVTFLDSISFMPMALRKLPEAFGLSASKSWYPHLFNTRANLNDVGSKPETVGLIPKAAGTAVTRIRRR